MTLSIKTIFGNESFDVDCVNLMASSFYMNVLVDDKITEVVLASDHGLEPDASTITKHLLTKDVYCYLTRIVVNDRVDEEDVHYEFNDNGKNYLMDSSYQTLLQVIVAFDCLDIKPILFALLDYVSKNYSKTDNEIIGEARLLRFERVKIYVK